MWKRALRSGAVVATATAAYYTTASVVTLDQQTKDVKTPGVYAWGLNKGVINSNEDGVVKTPTRIGWFDGKLLRDLELVEDHGFAVLENGDVVHWTKPSPTPQVVIKGKGIAKICISNNHIYAIGKNQSSIFAYNLGSNVTTQLDLPKLGWFEHVTDITVGKEHLVALTSTGRVFSGATGNEQGSKSQGQFGIASMSQFDKPPPPGTLHEVVQLNEFGAMAQIAAGDYHTIVKSKDGKAYGFGDNKFGQVGVPFSVRSANIAVPAIMKYEKLYGMYAKPTVQTIAAGGAGASFFTVDARNDDASLDTKHYAVGNGLTGQLGTGAMIHAQSKPQNLKSLSKLTEYSETLNKMVSIGISSWSVGATHCAVSLDTGANHDVMVWGGNEYYQLGTGKKSNANTPMTILPLDMPRDSEESSEMGERLQLFRNKKLRYVDDRGKTRTANVDQIIKACDRSTAVYYRKAE